MQRLVYRPKVDVFVKSDTGIINLSSHVVRGSVTRKIDQVSTANIEFRNPNKIFTPEKGSPLIHPMDPIVIFMQRLNNRPVQVFTGYVDSSPYFALRPTGNLSLSASCTLKRLLYTYYDPGLKFFHKFIQAQGWTVRGSEILSPDAQSPDTVGGTGQENNNNKFPEPIADELNDASFGQMLYQTLLYIGNWYPDTILIENLPNGLVDLVEGIFYQAESISKSERNLLKEQLEYILENNTFEGAVDFASSDSGVISPVNGTIIGLNNPEHERFCKLVAGGTGLSLRVLAAWCDVEGGPSDNPLNIGPGRVYGSIQAGARATVDLLKSSTYEIIMRSVGKPDVKQIRAIASSRWLTGQPVFTQSYYDSLYTIWKEIKIR